MSTTRRRWSYAQSPAGGGIRATPPPRKRAFSLGSRRRSQQTSTVTNNDKLVACFNAVRAKSHATERQPVKSSMKVKTLQESLSSSYGAAIKSKRWKLMSVQNSFRRNNKASSQSGRHLSASNKMSASTSSLVVVDGAGDDESPTKTTCPDQIGEERRRSETSSNAGSKEDPALDFRRSSMMKMKSSGGHHKSASMSKLFSSARNLGSSSARKLLGNRFSSLRNLLSSHESDESVATELTEMASSALSVRFDAVEVREYRSAVCDNPEVLSGPAVTLDWAYRTLGSCPLDKYEDTRGPRKDMNELALTKFDRTRRLLANGVSRRELLAAEKSSKRAQQRRMKTVNSRTASLEEKLEGAAHKFKKIVKLKKSREEEVDELWSKAQLYFAAY